MTPSQYGRIRSAIGTLVVAQNPILAKTPERVAELLKASTDNLLAVMREELGFRDADEHKPKIKACNTCKHGESFPSEDPCRACMEFTGHINWEPVQGFGKVVGTFGTVVEWPTLDHPTGQAEMLKQWLTEEKPVPRECHTCRLSDSYGTAACPATAQTHCGTEKKLWVPLNPPRGGRK